MGNSSEQVRVIESRAGKPRKPQLGEVLEPEMLATYLKHRRGTLLPYRDRITVYTGFGEERFDLVKVAQGVCWQRTR